MINTGVYILYHKYNPSKVYVGSTRALGFKQRFNNHVLDLKRNKHNNKHLQSVCNKYGIDGFMFNILQRYSPEYCLDAEKFWIDRLDSYYNGYNQSNNTYGYSSSIEKKREITSSQQKVVLQINSDNNIVNKFHGVLEAGRQTNINGKDISACCNKSSKVKMAGGFLWCFEKDYNENIKYKSKYHNMGVLQYDKNQNFIKEWKSIQLASDFYSNGQNGNITNCCNGKLKSAYGYIWKYKQ